MNELISISDNCRQDLPRIKLLSSLTVLTVRWPSFEQLFADADACHGSKVVYPLKSLNSSTKHLYTSIHFISGLKGKSGIAASG